MRDLAWPPEAEEDEVVFGETALTIWGTTVSS